MSIFTDYDHCTHLDLCEIKTEFDIVRARQVIREHAKKLFMGLVDQTRITTAASEILRNMFQYAGGGEVILELAVSMGRQAMLVTCVDHGAGIPDLEQAMTDGYTSGGGMGLGLPGSRRLVDDFFIESKINEGTTVKIAKWI